MAYVLSENRIPRLVPDPALSPEQRMEQWERKKIEILRRVQPLIGAMPVLDRVSFEVVGEKRLSDSVISREIVYTAYDGDDVTAFLLLPDNLTEQQKKPAVIALHQTSAYGKEEVAGVQGDPELAYGLELAERGFVVLAPDILTAGSRIFQDHDAFQTAPFEERYPEWSMIGKMICDHRAGVQLLADLEYVDAGRIGAIGHSLGGYNAFFLSAFETRIRAVVSSCGFSTFAGDPTPQRWGLRKEWFSHFPALDPWLARGEIPFEFNEVVALTFPRAFFNWSAQNDAIFPHWPSIGEGMLTVKELYESYGQEDRFVSLFGSYKHEFPLMIRKMAYNWLCEQLDKELKA